ncbi:MAG: UbiA prenyltransferase family protein [Nannocystaceae bacterium]
MLVALIKTLGRASGQNSFVGVPLFFALRLFDVVALSRSAAAIALFCLISGCVYVLNDIVDAPQDRLHLQKRHRPIASGALPVGVAKTFLVIAVPLVITGAILLSPRYAAVLGSFALNIAYSFRLKRVAYLDVLCIATFFIMRVLAGAFAIDVEPSHWLLACTFALLATFLGFGKRAHELAASVDADKQRAALRGYDLASLRGAASRGRGAGGRDLRAVHPQRTHHRDLRHRPADPGPCPSASSASCVFRTWRPRGTTPESDRKMLRDPLFMASFWSTSR